MDLVRRGRNSPNISYPYLSLSTDAGLHMVLARRGIFDPVTVRRYTSMAKPNAPNLLGPHIVVFMHDLETLARVFHRFAELECPGMSALYESLCNSLAGAG